MDTTKKCARNGCGKSYSEEENVEGACYYHPGGPLFHEGYKGWACCTKRVTDFDEFEKIPGCTPGIHSSHKEFVRPVETSPYSQHNQPPSGSKRDTPEIVSNKNNVEVYKTSTPPTRNPVRPPPEVPKEEPKPVEEDFDPPSAVIPKGTACKHRGCNKVFVDDNSRNEECIYHPGVPIFHETLKSWSCCNNRAVDFDQFLEIPGCKQGLHKFLDHKDATKETEVQCRYDWYQGATNVILTVYAKKVAKNESKVSFEPYKVKINFKFEDGKTFNKDIRLAGPIVPEQCKVDYLTTKVELKLSKEDGSQWTKLEP
jgi:hypothetical protein